ncbi:MAG: hypothetical protein AAB347_00320 [Bacteroidota bacterium]
MTGGEKTQKAGGETVETAFEHAQEIAGLHATIFVKSKTVIREPTQRSFTIQAFSESDAKKRFWAGEQSNGFQVTDIKDITLREPPRRGVLGIGKKPGTYMIEIFQNAIVEIDYAQKTKVIAMIGRYQP